MSRRVFISYSSRDRPDALRLKEIVEADGHDAWMDLFDIQPAGRLDDELEQGVTTADVLCLLISPSAVASPWVHHELLHAVAAEAKGLRVMPIIVRAAPIPDELADRVAVDAMRGLDDPAVALRVRRALGSDVGEGLLLDAVRRAELADRAATDEIEEALPRHRESLDRVMVQPIRALSVQVDQDTWPDGTGSVLEVVLAIDEFVGQLSILLAPYVEGHSWRPDAGIDERPPEDFFASSKPRVDARLRWAGRTVSAVRVEDGTDLGEEPLKLDFTLPGDEYTSLERGSTMLLLDRFELPNLRQLIDGGASVTVWLHAPGGVEPRQVDPAATDLRLRLEVPMRHDRDGIYGFRLWGHHDRTDQVLLRAATLRACTSVVEREALLSLYRNAPLRAELSSADRRRRLMAAVDHGDPVDDADRWATFVLSAGRADLRRLRGDVRQAAQYLHDSVGLLADIPAQAMDYPQAFQLLGALTQLVDDLSLSGGTHEALVFYSDDVVRLGRELRELRPEEADFSRALSRNLLQRARLFPGTPAAASDVREAVTVMEDLVRAEPLPWRIDEARAARRDAEALLAEWGAAGDGLAPPPAAAGTPAGWLDPESIADVVPTLLFDRLLRFGTRVPPSVPASGPQLSVCGDELLGVWSSPDSAAGLVIGLSAVAHRTADVPTPALAGTALQALPRGGGWSMLDAQEEVAPPQLLERLGVASVRAVRLTLRRTGREGDVLGYLLLAEKDGLRWRICLTLDPSGDDWRSRANDDAIAAVVFTHLRIG